MGHLRGLTLKLKDCPSSDAATLKHTPTDYSANSPSFWYMLLASVALVLFAGLMSGLTLGLLSIEKLDLRVIQKSGATSEKQQAAKVQRLLRNEHRLLVTLLLFNAVAMEALPLFLNNIVPEAIAVLISVTAVLLFGEIVPQAVCKAFGLAVGAVAAPLVECLMLISMPITWPIGKVLDFCLGHDAGRAYKRSQMLALLQIHYEDGYITRDEESVMHGALELVEKTCGVCMTPVDNVKSVADTSVLDEATLDWMLDTGHSRILVHAEGDRDVVCGILLVKKLLRCDPKAATPVSSLELSPVVCVHEDTELYKVLEIFQTGRSHLAAVYPKGTNMGETGFTAPAGSRAMGIVTLEDVIEELLSQEIVDETDKFVHAEDPSMGFAEEWRTRCSLQGKTPQSARSSRVSRFKQRASATSDVKKKDYDASPLSAARARSDSQTNMISPAPVSIGTSSVDEEV